MLGTFEAGYGIVQYLTGYQKIFGMTKQFYTEEATGTYINHNHFAGLLEPPRTTASASSVCISDAVTSIIWAW